MDPTPLARVLLPQRVPLGFHACWAPNAEMEAIAKRAEAAALVIVFA